MSSTTDRRSGQQGQILVLFAGGLITLLLFAALAYDGGMVLAEHRDQQDAADAAALAGARYLDPPRDVAAASAAAFSVAADNGYVDGVDAESVVVNLPPTSGPNAGRTGFIEVLISSVEPSLFARVIGLLNWDVGARAVAANDGGGGANFSMMALDPDGCAALQVTGNGVVNSYGNIQVNSTCPSNALQRTGGGTIDILADGASCNVAGGVQSSGSGELLCDVNTGALALQDPLGGLDPPSVPGYPAAPFQVAGTPKTIPDGCPGSAVPATWEVPATCQFTSSYAGTTWRLYPGYYPGGITLQGGTYYLQPGIYYIGGGGVSFHGVGIDVTSVASGGTSLDFGIMFYNTEAQDTGPADTPPNISVHAWCQAYFADPVNWVNPDPTNFDPNVRCIQPIVLNGSSADIDLYPLKQGSAWDGLVIFQCGCATYDLDTLGDDVQINGSSSDIQVRGTIYVPHGSVKANGNGGTVTLDQIIAYDFKVSGNSGTVNVMNDQNFVFQVLHVGLVE